MNTVVTAYAASVSAVCDMAGGTGRIEAVTATVFREDVRAEDEGKVELVVVSAWRRQVVGCFTAVKRYCCRHGGLFGNRS
jgi:hypothetical protein